MKYLVILVAVLGAYSCSKKSHTINKDIIDGVDTCLSATERNTDSAYINRWCPMVDSMTLSGRKLLPSKYYALLKRGQKVSKEYKVYETLSTLCTLGDTVFFIERINTVTAKISFNFWKKSKGSIYKTEKLYFYSYYPHIHQNKNLKAGSIDSVHISNYPEFYSCSEMLLNVCNMWNTKRLQTDKNLDRALSHYILLAYRTILKKDLPLIECVKIADQGNANSDVNEPYAIILTD